MAPDDKTQKMLPVNTILAGRYELLEKIGAGGMGTVYRGRHIEIGREVAIKVLYPDQSADDREIQRFKQEAKLAATLSHGNVGAVYDFGETPEGFLFLIMDYIHGPNLSQELRANGPMEDVKAIPLFIQIASGLAHAHRRGLVHRDLKPSNIMLVSDGPTRHAKIVDFGIAKALGEHEQGLTKTGELFGSPLYMSPEQCAGQPLDGRSDLYSLGCVMFETLSGKAPFKGETIVQTIFKHMNEDPEALNVVRPGINISPELENIITTCMQKSPDRRFQNADDLVAALEGLKECPNMRLGQNGSSSTTNAQSAQRKITAPFSKKVSQLPKILMGIGIACVVGLGAYTAYSYFREPEPAWLVDPANNPPVVYNNPQATGEPEVQVMYTHQAFDQGRSLDNDYQHVGHVRVDVNNDKETILVLGAFAPIIWKVQASPRYLKEVILFGTHEQQLRGVPSSVPVRSTSDRIPPDATVPKDYYLERKNPLFASPSFDLSTPEEVPEYSNYVQLQNEIKKLTGRDITTFQYLGQAKEFSVPPQKK